MHSCEPVAVEGNVVVLGFSHQFHRSKVEEDRNKRIVEEVLSDLLGQPHRVRCTLAAAKKQLVGKTQNPAPAVSRKMKDPEGVLDAAKKQLVGKTQNPAPAVSHKMKDPEGVLDAQQERAASDTKPPLSAEQIIADDPLVREAVEELGAQIVQK